jgi:glycine/D-amino acid oxidase-like deaminating enzyme
LFSQCLQQYQHLEGDFADYLTDPYTRRVEPREPLADSVDVIIIGGGFSSLLTTARLREAGVTSTRVIEKGGDVGGVSVAPVLASYWHSRRPSLPLLYFSLPLRHTPSLPLLPDLVLEPIPWRRMRRRVVLVLAFAGRDGLRPSPEVRGRAGDLQALPGHR